MQRWPVVHDSVTHHRNTANRMSLGLSCVGTGHAQNSFLLHPLLLRSHEDVVQADIKTILILPGHGRSWCLRQIWDPTDSWTEAMHARCDMCLQREWYKQRHLLRDMPLDLFVMLVCSNDMGMICSIVRRAA